MMVNNLKRKSNKKQLILDAATKIFIQEGYKKASIAEIAKEANSSQVTLYKYYPSKVELARAVIIRLIVDGYRESEEFLDVDGATFVDKMEKMMAYGVDMSQSINDDFVVFMYNEFSGQNGSTSVMKTYNDYKHGFWKKLLDQGRAEGAVSPQITDEGAGIYLDMFISYAMNSNPANAHTAVEIKKHEDDLMHLFFYGLMGH